MKGSSLTTGQVAERLGVTTRTVLNWIEDNKLRAARVHPDVDGSPYRVPLSEVERIEQERKRQLRN